MSTGVQSATIAKLFGDGEMLSIGGTYRNRYTIWREWFIMLFLYN